MLFNLWPPTMGLCAAEGPDCGPLNFIRKDHAELVKATQSILVLLQFENHLKLFEKFILS